MILLGANKHGWMDGLAVSLLLCQRRVFCRGCLACCSARLQSAAVCWFCCCQRPWTARCLRPSRTLRIGPRSNPRLTSRIRCRTRCHQYRTTTSWTATQHLPTVPFSLYYTPCSVKSGPWCFLCIIFINVGRFKWKLSHCIRYTFFLTLQCFTYRSF